MHEVREKGLMRLGCTDGCPSKHFRLGLIRDQDMHNANHFFPGLLFYNLKQLHGSAEGAEIVSFQHVANGQMGQA